MLAILIVLSLSIASAVAYIIHSTTKNIERFTLDPNAGANQGVDPNGSAEPFSAEPTPEANNALNFLILGSDSRISAGDPTKWRAGAQRTDAMMILQVNGDRTGINIVSIPRDSWVSIPGYHKAKINAAFSYGGPNLAVKTVQDLTGVRIDHFAIVDFNSFKTLTDELGGVSINTTQGQMTMNGEEALKFVRERKHLANGDFDRARRQQAWMRAMAAKTFTSDVLSSPSKVMSLIEVATKNSALDDGLTVPKMVSLAAETRNIRAKNMNFFLAPVAGVGRSADGQSIVNLDYSQFDPLMKAFATDKVSQYLQEHPEAEKYLLKSKVR
ncbi:hypothetical protein BK816_00510 [Boudabousia tangfeifanii]|uniref:Cell envelope-related transcriptional attenuator domain-containing protein n=1 Tax=Boudabousia tangfeifanii TaxID=1912795 RepID=A0A1D9MMC6_9ACTO|nr:hypothetical protein BK816_00510 [Boudabousia tangfeifanii]